MKDLKKLIFILTIFGLVVYLFFRNEMIKDANILENKTHTELQEFNEKTSMYNRS